MEIQGYKAFYKNHTNRYGVLFEEGKIYNIEGQIKFGNTGNGHHFCKRFEDTLRYFDGKSDNVSFAKVIGSGIITEYSDDYYGYYDMYACSQLKIISFLSDKDIFDLIKSNVMISNLYKEGLFRIIQGYKLSDQQIQYILNNINIQYDYYYEAIEYYQKDQKDIYIKKLRRCK